MNNFSKSLSFLALTLSLSTQAGGLWLNEYADPAMGKAGAGSQAGVNDASTVVRNPATMGRLDGSQYLLGAMAIYSQAEFEIESAGSLNGDKNPDDAGGLAPAASFYYTHKIDDKWSWGISSGALAGSALDYGKD
ncbi:MAG: outer membrane protein transport protein, partial [Thalassotalea sp.]|nr:outer membrane protein transport protein [Thalassotalea sp.]